MRRTIQLLLCALAMFAMAEPAVAGPEAGMHHKVMRIDPSRSTRAFMKYNRTPDRFQEAENEPVPGPAPTPPKPAPPQPFPPQPEPGPAPTPPTPIPM